MSRAGIIVLFAIVSGFGIGEGTGSTNEELFTASPLTEKNSFTPGIEGPACDRAGNLFVVKRLLQVRVDRPGLAWLRWQEKE